MRDASVSSIQNENGSTLFITLIGFLVVATILSGSTFLVPALWQNTRAYGQRALALQTAESGLQHAIAWISSNGIADFMTQYPYRSSQTAHTIPNGGSFYVVYDSVGHVLKSTGNYESATRDLAIDVTTNAEPVLFKQAIYSAIGSGGGQPVFRLDGSSRIIGDVSINAAEAGAVYFAWATQVTGNFHIGPGGDPDKVIDGDRPDPSTNIGGIVESSTETAAFVMPEYPTFPTGLPNCGAFTAGWWPPPPYYITQSGSYGKMNVESELIVDLTGGDVTILADELSVTGAGKITLRGNGKLRLYVKNKFTLAGSGSINAGGDATSLSMFYSGTTEFAVPGSAKFVGSVYAKSANVYIEGSGSSIGSIITGGSSVKLNGAASAIVRAIYAPNANLVMTGSAYLKGAVVAKTISLSGASIVEWAEVDYTELPVEIPEPGGADVITLFSKWRVMR